MRRLVAGLALALALAGCTTLPDSGQVHTRPEPSRTTDEAPYFAPPGPHPSDSPQQVVNGFLTAMQANPPGAEVARRFLARAVRDTWNPSLGTIVYEAAPVTARGTLVQVGLSDVQRLDARGGWIAGPSGRTATLSLRVVRELGEWRIIDPPDALVVPRSYFTSLFAPLDVYFFDQTRRVLVPQRIYLPSGEQTTTNLVRRLLLGPGGGLASVTRTSFPAGTVLELGVVVSDTGVAVVPLSSQILRVSQDERDAALAQLARTLGQVPGIERIRVTVDGTPVPLRGGRTDMPADHGGAALDAGSRVEDPAPLVFRGGRLYRLVGHALRPVGGGLGRPGYALRSIGYDEGQDLVAGTSADGARVFVAGTAGKAPVRSLLRGHDLDRPAFDMFGTLWVLDRTATGARVLVTERHGKRPVTRTVRFPGISGRPVTGLVVTQDGTRLVAALASGILVQEPVLRTATGHVEGGGGPRPLQLPVTDPGRVLDLDQVAPTTIGVLFRPESGTDQVAYTELDGAPGGPDEITPVEVPERGVQLVAGPLPSMPLRVLTSEHELIRLASGPQWVPDRGDDISAAAYPR